MIMGLTFLAIAQISNGATLYVDAGGATSGSCDSWANACTLSYALSLAGSGDSAWVTAGTYTGPYTLVNGVKLIGGFAGTESAASQSDPTTNVTTIDGNGARALESTDDGPSTLLRGFTISGGADTGFDGGGAILLNNSSLFVVDCVFTANTATWWGGAASIRGVSSPTFINCVFSGNGIAEGSTTIAGGAVYLHFGSVTFTNCLFYDNSAYEGGAIAVMEGNVTLHNSTVANNAATVGSGGGIFDKYGGATITNSIFWGNTAGRNGAQIHNAPGVESTVSESDISGGYTGTGNINSDPLFAYPGHGDFTLQSTSPCKDAGGNQLLPADSGDLDWDSNVSEDIPKDLKRETRKINFTVDMGCYEAPLSGGGQ